MEKPVQLRADLLYLVETGGDPDRVLDGMGVSFAEIIALTPMPTAKIAELCDVLAARLPDDFAINSGLATRLQAMGILGFRLLNCDSLHELLETWSRYSIVIGYPLASRLVVTGKRWNLEFRPRYSLSPRALRFCMETTVAGTIPAIHAISGHVIEPLGFAFPFAEPDSLARYAKLSPTPIAFGRDFGAVTGVAADLRRVMVATDGEAKVVSESYCAQALAKITHSETISERLRAQFIASPGRFPTARAAAARLNISLRTLQRQLSSEGHSYQRLAETFRHEKACELLEQGVESKTVSYLLGFRDIGSFRRAFRSWTGHAPSYWRHNLVDRRASGALTQI